LWLLGVPVARKSHRYLRDWRPYSLIDDAQPELTMFVLHRAGRGIA
jgi:hypothetical protein